MHLPITPQRLAAIYEMLRTWPPFNRWKLPPASSLRFHVSRARGHDAQWWISGNKHHIETSERRHYHLLTLIISMAHEMIHVRQLEARTETPGVEHNAEFRRISRRLCRRYGWDEGQFIE